MTRHCTRCGEPFETADEHDYADVLDHWAREHNDAEEFWRVVGDARTWARCGGCGEMFPSEIRPHDDGLAVRLYCNECADNGLENKLKTLIATDVTARYVLENEVCQGQ